MRNHFLEEVTVEEKMEIINYLDSQFNDESSRTVTELAKVVALPKSTYYESKSRKPSNQQKRKESCITVRTTSVYMAELGLRAITTPKYNAPKNHPQQLPL